MKKEVKGLMGGRFRVITQVFCVLVLALSLSLAAVMPVIAADFPSISPTTAQYNLDDPAEVVTALTWGVASSIVAITDDDGHTLTQGLVSDYIVLVKHLIILDNYLKNELKDIGDSVELIMRFDVGAATLNITAIGTQPSISPTTAQYNLNSPADVKTTVTWGIATSVASVVDDEGHTLTGSEYSVTAITPGVSADVTVRSGSYLAGMLTDIGSADAGPPKACCRSRAWAVSRRWEKTVASTDRAAAPSAFLVHFAHTCRDSCLTASAA